MSTDTVYRRFEATAQRLSGNAPFLHVLEETAAVYGIDAGDITYAEMLQRVQERAQAFADSGYGPGLRVGLLLENRPVFIELWLALNSLGVSVVPINPDLRATEIRYLLQHSEMCLAIVLPERRTDVEQAVEESSLQVSVITPADAVPRVTQERASIDSIGNATECALLYTSGTTGNPKGCMLSNEYFLHSGDWYAETGGHISLQTDTERMLTPLPLFHMNAMAVSVTAMLTVGGCLILLDRFHPRSWWQSVRDSRATVVHYLGVMPSILMQAAAAATDRSHNVRFGFGAGVDKKLHAAFEERFGFPLIEAWACTETGSGGVVSAHEEPRHVGTSCFGRPCNNVEVRVVDDTGADVASGTQGELLVRRAGSNPHYGFFSGYYKDAEATDELWRDGWLHTGDVVRQGADGSLYFIDRKKNVIRRSGENIAAVDVETVLNRHPGIAQCAAVAAPDELRGDEVAVFIVPDGADGNAGCSVSAADAEREAVEIVHWALAQMTYYKAPGLIAFIDELPVTATQKIKRGELKPLLQRTLAEGGFIDTRHLKKRSVG
jgi:acyl-CoA synthetase (AMP-forming)/AMP-acid ligase II